MRLRRRIAARLAPHRRVVVWGAGGLGRTALARWLPRDKIVAVIDVNPARHGEHVAGIAVVAPSALAGLDADCVVICTSVYAEVLVQLREAGFAGDRLYVYEAMLPADGSTPGHWERLCIDLAATRNTDWLRLVLLKPQIAVNVTFRLTNACAGIPLLWPLYAAFYVLHAIACIMFSIQVPVETPAGPGLIFAHYGTIVVTARARLGAFCTLYQGVTVGTNDSGEGPVLEDFVTVYAGAKVLGRTTIGAHSRVGANAVVLDLASGSYASVAGMPARVIARKAVAA